MKDQAGNAPTRFTFPTDATAAPMILSKMTEQKPLFA